VIRNLKKISQALNQDSSEIPRNPLSSGTMVIDLVLYALIVTATYQQFTRSFNNIHFRKGATGAVFQGVNKHNGEPVAVKTFNQLSHMR
jgi:hypothetical protein